jgi:hypothetical protein
MITANVWERVVNVRCGDISGTGFTVDQQGTQYLVTARHVVDSANPLDILVRGTSVPVNLDRLPVPNTDADVAVFRPDHPITPDLPLPADMEGLVFGQDAYFLGFPLGLTFDIGATEYFPLIKRGTVSGVNHRVGSRAILLLDGWNNPGFSGGPVVFRPAIGPGVNGGFHVAGVVTAYHAEAGPVMIGGQIVPGAEVLLNSGIIIVEEIARVVEAIQQAS